jgi:hypothetical protein
LRLGNKSDIKVCLEKGYPVQAEAPNVDALLLDGAAIVNMIKPSAAKTFSNYNVCTKVFIPFMVSQLHQTSRVDLVWDEYIPDSLKFGQAQDCLTTGRHFSGWMKRKLSSSDTWQNKL